jgi:hypothetical protein
MLRWILLAVLVVALTAGATFVAQFVQITASPDGGLSLPNTRAEESGPPAKAVIVDGGDLTHQFGTMAQHSKGEKLWTIKNEGTGDLKLSQGTASCSCTIANLRDGKTAVLKPGETTTVRLEWNTKEASGKYTQRAEVLTHNDPNMQKFEFIVTGMVSPAIITVPPGTTIPFMNVSNQESHKARFALFSPDKTDLEITSLTTSKPQWIDVTSKPLTKEEADNLEAKSGFRIDLELKAGLPLGDIHEVLVIKTNHPKQPELKMSIQGKAVGPISVMPDHVRMIWRAGGSQMKQTLSIWVRGRDKTNFEVVKSPRNLKATFAAADDTPKTADQGGKARRYQMTVTVEPGTPPGQIDGAFILKTDHPNAAELKIPVNVRVEATEG